MASDVIKNLNVKVFNLMSRTDETRHIEWHETCTSKCRLHAIVCNNKQRWNDDKCRWERRELIDKRICNKGFIENPTNYECECDKSCDLDEYLDYENSKWRKKLFDKLIAECPENVEEAKLATITSVMHENKHKCSSCMLHIVLFSVISTINIEIATYFVYCEYLNHR